MLRRTLVRLDFIATKCIRMQQVKSVQKVQEFDAREDQKRYIAGLKKKDFKN